MYNASKENIYWSMIVFIMLGNKFV